MYSKFEAAEM